MMKRIFPRTIQDKFKLSYILERYLGALKASPLQVRLSAIAYDTRIPECIFQRLMDLQRNPDDLPYIQAEDFHIVFSNVLSRFPTAKIWQQDNGEIFIEL